MDDARTHAILDMLSELHGEIAGLRYDAGGTDERLDIIEADLRALVPLVADGLAEAARTAARLAALEARLGATGR